MRCRASLLSVLLVCTASACSLFREPPAGEDEEGAPVITDVDGDGSDRPVTADIDEGDRAAAHRVRAGLVVRGTGFVDISGIELRDGDVVVHEPPFTVESPVRLTIDLATLPRAGLFTLAVVGAAGTANAQVFVLQGEPGLTTRSVVRDADVDDCPFGGEVVRSGVDEDDDGDLDDEEVTGEDVRCDQVVSGEHRLVVDDEEALRSALTALGELRIAPSATVTVLLPEGDLLMTEPLVIDHFDGRRLRLTSAGDNTRLRFVGTKLGIDVRHGGVSLSKLTVSGGVQDAVVGIAADFGAVVVVDGALAVDGWTTGLQAHNGALVFSAGPHAIEVEDCVTGIEVSLDGAMVANAVHISGADVGIAASFKGVFGGVGLTITGNDADNGNKASIAIRAADHAAIGLDGATFLHGNHLFMSGGSRAVLNGSTSTLATGNVAVIADTGSTMRGIDYAITTTSTLPTVVARDLGQVSLVRGTGNTDLPDVTGLAEANGTVVLLATDSCTTASGGICTGPSQQP